MPTGISTFQEFLDSPFKMNHVAFRDAELAISPAPEFATSEVMLSGLVRRSGYPKVPEREVQSMSRNLRSTLDRREPPPGARFSVEEWRLILEGTLESPRRLGESRDRHAQFTPVVPFLSAFSGTARLGRNSWSPGNLIARMVLLGSDCQGDADRTWKAIHDGLTVDADDDIWARWLNSEFLIWKSALSPEDQDKVDWQVDPLIRAGDEFGWNFAKDDGHVLKANGTWYPARAFVHDLVHVLGAKSAMTRRQWISMLDAVVRIASVSHVLWLCNVTFRIWLLINKGLHGAPPPDVESVRKSMYPETYKILDFERPALAPVTATIKEYLYARLGINTVLHALTDLVPDCEPLSSSIGVHSLLESIATHRDALSGKDVIGKWKIFDSKLTRALSCEASIGKNMVEFVQHVLGQRQASEESQREYDQGYFVRKRTREKNSQWVVQMGSVAAYAMVHCCLSETRGPRSVARLCDHLGRYGIRVPKDAVAMSDLGQKLRSLAMVVDSPDAESGMLVVPPFRSAWPSADGMRS